MGLMWEPGGVGSGFEGGRGRGRGAVRLLSTAAVRGVRQC